MGPHTCYHKDPFRPSKLGAAYQAVGVHRASSPQSPFFQSQQALSKARLLPQPMKELIGHLSSSFFWLLPHTSLQLYLYLRFNARRESVSRIRSKTTVSGRPNTCVWGSRLGNAMIRVVGNTMLGLGLSDPISLASNTRVRHQSDENIVLPPPLESLKPYRTQVSSQYY